MLSKSDRKVSKVIKAALQDRLLINRPLLELVIRGLVAEGRQKDADFWTAILNDAWDLYDLQQHIDADPYMMLSLFDSTMT